MDWFLYDRGLHHKRLKKSTFIYAPAQQFSVVIPMEYDKLFKAISENEGSEIIVACFC